MGSYRGDYKNTTGLPYFGISPPKGHLKNCIPSGACVCGIEGYLKRPVYKI